jgi:hypothetical protein
MGALVWRLVSKVSMKTLPETQTEATQFKQSLRVFNWLKTVVSK